MTLNSRALAAFVFTMLFGGILIASGLGWWKTESTRIAATFAEGEFAGQANPADIRGSYTFADVEKNFGVPAALLGEAFGIRENPAAFQIKGLEALSAETGIEVGTSSVRLFVAFYKNLPFDLSADIYLPQSAADLLAARPLTAEQSAYLATHTIAGGAAPEPVISATPVPESTAVPAAASARLIKGKTTFGELSSWGLSQASIEQILGLPVPATPSITIKDFCTTNNLTFETIKSALQAEVDRLE